MKRTDDGGIRLVVVATGIASVAVQLVCVREYLAQFHGNEIVIALIFFCWLFFGGLGTLFAKGFRPSSGSASPQRLAFFSCLLILLAVGQVTAIRQLRDVVFTHGVSVGFYSTFGFVAATILPYACLLGFVLPYSLLVARQRIGEFPGNWIYMADNMGDVTGGALFSFILVHWLTPYRILLVIHLPLLVAVVRLEGTRSGKTVLACVLSILVLLAGVFLEERLLPVREGQRVYYSESRYGRIEVVDAHGEYSIFTDGVPGFVSRDPALAEEVVHFSLSQIVRPRRILLISSVGGVMAEIAKYGPDRVDYLELDPMAAQLQFRFGQMKPQEGLTVISRDARVYLAQSPVQYDAILVCLPEPETFQVNRFFTENFFRLAKAHLAPGGVFSFGVDGVANYISESRSRKLSSLANTAKMVFPHVLLLPGSRIFFICRDRPVQTDIPELLAEKGIETLHIQRFYFGDLTEQRIRWLNDTVDRDIGRNRDLSPHLMQQVFMDWFSRHGESPRWFILILAVSTLVYLALLSRAQWVLFTTGCVSMGAEMVAIFAFQILYGYVYLQIGVLVTVFLAGLLPGAYLGGRFAGNRPKMVMATDLLLSLLLIGFSLILFVDWQSTPAIVLYIFGLSISFCCGFQFPLALTIAGDSTSAAANSFSADLAGAGIGVLLVSLILIPFAGLLWAILCLAAMKLMSFMIAGTIHDTN